MPGGSRLLWIVACLSLIAALAWAEDDSVSSGAPAGPPKAKVDVVEETLHGHKIADPYRGLENADAPSTEKFVEQENALTFDYLAKLPGRDAIKKQLTDLWNYEKFGGFQKAG